MKTLETDLELLEEYLDGAMESATQSELLRRLASDAELSAALTRLQSQRALRQAAYQTMEPGDLAAQQLLWRIRGAMLNQNQNGTTERKRPWSQWGSPWRIASVGSAAAACMMLGFVFGRLGNNPAVTPSVLPSQNPIVNVMNENSAPPVAENHPSQFTPVGPVSVPITNEYGQVVAWQTFNSPEQAKNFTEDLNKTRSQMSQPANSTQPKLVDAPAQVPF